MKNIVAAGVMALASSFQIGVTHAAEIKMLMAAGMRPVMEDLGPKFERATGHTLAMQFAPASAIVKRLRDGEAADIVITPWGMETLSGSFVPDSVTVVARARLGIAVRKGAAKPDVSSPEAFKRALLAAASITYLNPAQEGESGYLFAKVLDRLNIANEMKSKTVIPKTTAAVGGLVASGEAEMAVLALQHIQFISATGIELVGPMPSELQETMVFSAAIMKAATDARASSALLIFLRSPEAATVMRAKGMDSPAN